MRSRKVVLALAFAVLLGALMLAVHFLAASGLARPQLYRRTSRAMGTFVTVAAWSGDRSHAEEALDLALEEIRLLEGLLSTFDGKSELSEINGAPPGRPVLVSPATLEALGVARRVWRESGGAFDPTVGPLVELWRRAREEGRLPSDEEIEAARSKVGFEQVEVEGETTSVAVGSAGVRLDLAALAKGLAAERATRALAASGIRSGFADVGGDVCFLGSGPSGRPWRAGISDPRDPEQVVETLHVSARAVVTSGNYQQVSVVEGKRISHIIDPRTGRPADGPDSVTVVAADGAEADAWATALSVLGAGGADAARGAGVEFVMYFVEDGGLRRFASEGIREYEGGSR